MGGGGYTTYLAIPACLANSVKLTQLAQLSYRGGGYNSSSCSKSELPQLHEANSTEPAEWGVGPKFRTAGFLSVAGWSSVGEATQNLGSF